MIEEKIPNLITSEEYQQKGESFKKLPESEKERREFCDTLLRPPFQKPKVKDADWRAWRIAHQHLIKRETGGQFEQHGYDFIVMKGEDKNKGGEAGRSEIENFHCFGEKILSPGKGTIICAVDGFEDKPYIKYESEEEFRKNQDFKNPAGNFIIIDHGNGEYSQLCHFKKGSIKVKEGQAVGIGDELGECGNSGNSTMPHLHYHLFKLQEGYNIKNIINTSKSPFPLKDGSPIREGTYGVKMKFNIKEEEMILRQGDWVEL